MPNSISTTIDEYGHTQRLGRVDFWVPGKANDQDAQLEIPTQWAVEQHCPDHPMAFDPKTMLSWTAVRAKWERVPGGERPAVMFMCPKGHPFEVILPEPKSGRY